MNGKRIITVYLSVILAFMPLVGCITTDYKPLLLRRYQQQMTWAVNDAGISGRIASGKSTLRSGRLDGTFAPVELVVDPESGKSQVELSLAEAVQRALANNPAIMVVSYNPALSREEIITAEAEFDAVLKSSWSLQKLDAQSNYPSVIGRSKESEFSVSLSQRLITGGEASISYAFTRTRTYNPSYFNDPNYASKTSISLTQPLLRDFGPDVNMAKTRVARINYDISLHAFRSEVLATLEEVQTLYWRLVQARQDIAIRKRQLERARHTLDRVVGRSRLDASSVQLTHARSVVESSRLYLVQAERTLGDVQGRLIKAIGDPSLQLFGDYEIIPTTHMSMSPVKFDPVDQLKTALKYNPDLEQVRRAIEIQDISVSVAKNQALPRLDLQVGAAYNGAVASEFQGSWNQMNGGDYVDYNVNLQFEWPIGNRAQSANIRRARYSKSQSIARLQDTSDQLAVAIGEALRLIEFSYKEIEVSSQSLEAYVANLDALEARSETVEALTPDFLNRLLQAQDNVAGAERAVIDAMVRYNAAQASLMKLNGTAMAEMGVIVDDNEDVLELLGQYVDLTGNTEDTALSPSEVIKQIESKAVPTNKPDPQNEIDPAMLR